MLAILTLSLCWSIGVATLVIGHLSLFSVMFISIVIGIGIDYGIYFLFRYEEELFLGRNLQEAHRDHGGPHRPRDAAERRHRRGHLLRAVPHRLPRACRSSASSPARAILLSWLAMMTVFPATLVLVDRRHADRPRGTMPRAIALESHPRAARRPHHRSPAHGPGRERRC